MTYFPKIVENKNPVKCPGCGKWFLPTPGMENTSCTVWHGPGTCCHYSETEVPAPPAGTPNAVEGEPTLIEELAHALATAEKGWLEASAALADYEVVKEMLVASQQEVERLKDELAYECINHATRERRIETLRAQLAAAQKDTERMEFILSNCTVSLDGYELADIAELDAAIYAARQSDAAGKEEG